MTKNREDLLHELLPEHRRLVVPMLDTLSRYGSHTPQNLESYLVGLYIEALEQEVVRLKTDVSQWGLK